MTDCKKRVFLTELAEYLPHDDILSDKQKQALQELNYDALDGWAKTVYDYFDCHVDDCGNILSIENFLLNFCQNPCDRQRYEKANDLFIKNLFAKQDPLIFLDVDNTLTDLGHLSQEKIDFISNFEEKNRIILTTGKAYPSIKNVIDDCNIFDNYSSCLNGSVVINKGVQNCIAKVGKVSREIVEIFKNAPFDCVVYYQDGIRVFNPLTQKNLDLLKQYNEDFVTDNDIDFDKVVKVLFFIYEGEDQKENFVKEKLAHYPDLVCMRTAGHTFEVLHKNQHKGNTVRIISKLLGRYYRNTVGVGDSMNDAQLLNYVGKGMVVSTASQELKKSGYEVGDDDRKIDIVKIIKKYQ